MDNFINFLSGAIPTIIMLIFFALIAVPTIGALIGFIIEFVRGIIGK